VYVGLQAMLRVPAGTIQRPVGCG